MLKRLAVAAPTSFRAVPRETTPSGSLAGTAVYRRRPIYAYERYSNTKNIANITNQPATATASAGEEKVISGRPSPEIPR